MNIVLAVAISSEPPYSKLINLFYKGVYYISTNLYFYYKYLKAMEDFPAKPN